jgi:hypothetical protein
MNELRDVKCYSKTTLRDPLKIGDSKFEVKPGSTGVCAHMLSLLP